MDGKLQKNELAGTVTFTPPLYMQRYQFIKQLVSRYKPKKVADLGCADCRLLWMLKFCKCIEVLVGLDICEDVMKEKIIEHLEAKELEKFPEVVFGFMSPAVVIISTPNAEFNPLLPAVTLFRHPDHKFEWNRAQFQNWAQNAAAHYDYTVEFTGLGAAPPGKDVGFCTQIGVFVRNYTRNGEPDRLEKYQEHVYKTVFKAVYPSLKDEKYLQNAVINEVSRTAQIIARRLLDHRKPVYKKHCDDPVGTEPRSQPSCCFLRYVENPSFAEASHESMQSFICGNTVCVPLAKLLSFPKVKQLCGTLEVLSKLVTGKIALSSDGSAVLIDAEYENEEQEH